MPPDAYLSILEAPLDPYVVPDQGDEGGAKVTLSGPERRRAEKPPTPIVPYFRLISLGSYGKDVQGAKRALWRANGLGVPKQPTQTFGPVAVKQLRTFQKTHGLAQDGVLGPTTLRKLGPSFDQYAFFLYTGYPPGASKKQQARTLKVAYALWGYNNRVSIHYAEFRPMTHMDALQLLPVSEDCSTFATKDFKFAKVADPNGLNYNGYGNTGTMRQHGRVVSLADAKPGDLVHYNDPQHVAVYVGHDRVVTHGSEVGPLLSAVDYRPIAEIRTYE